MIGTNEHIDLEAKEVIYQPQVFWINIERYTETNSSNYFVRGSDQRSFKGLEVVEATSVVKAANQMQHALVTVAAVMCADNTPMDIIKAVADALELAKGN